MPFCSPDHGDHAAYSQALSQYLSDCRLPRKVVHKEEQRQRPLGGLSRGAHRYHIDALLLSAEPLGAYLRHEHRAVQQACKRTDRSRGLVQPKLSTGWATSETGEAAGGGPAREKREPGPLHRGCFISLPPRYLLEEKVKADMLGATMLVAVLVSPWVCTTVPEGVWLDAGPR